MKKINILSIAVAAATLFSSSSVFAAHEQEKANELQKATTTFEKHAVASGKLTEDNGKCWGEMKQSLGVK